MARRYGDFVKLHKRLRTELPGKFLPPLPRKNKRSTTSTFFGGSGDDETSSVSSVSTHENGPQADDESRGRLATNLGVGSARRSISRSSALSKSPKSPKSPRLSSDHGEVVVLYREEQRVSLRAFLRTLLQNKRIADSKAMKEFLTSQPIVLTEEDLVDIQRRRDADAARIEEQQRFYEIARQRAAELDVYMENFRRDIVESSECLSLS